MEIKMSVVSLAVDRGSKTTQLGLAFVHCCTIITIKSSRYREEQVFFPVQRGKLQPTAIATLTATATIIVRSTARPSFVLLRYWHRLPQVYRADKPSRDVTDQIIALFLPAYLLLKPEPWY